MQREQFTKLMDETYDVLKGLNQTKGHDYAGDDDALNNFKSAGERVGLDPIQVWGIYFLKHIAAIETFVKEGNVKSEPIEGRIQDAILYLFLLLGLIAEQAGEQIVQKKSAKQMQGEMVGGGGLNRGLDGD